MDVYDLITVNNILVRSCSKNLSVLRKPGLNTARLAGLIRAEQRTLALEVARAH